ncbi:hypothetical protein [Microvirga massiliensis]|uniref:hypothetical protein n=1 Tax=Microvirga massiliensis TaxID=1033741 RepID=UPI00062B5873|nr:hypothetical protein [Microvirga massiliensis]
MAKDKSSKSKGKKAKKASSDSVAGVKVPKTIRKSSWFSTLFDSPLGREILADALIAAAGAAAAALTKTRPAQAVGHAVADRGSDAAAATRDTVQTAAGAVAEVVADAARNVLPTALLGETEDDKQEAKGQRTRYVHRASDHQSRKHSRRSAKDG